MIVYFKKHEIGYWKSYTYDKLMSRQQHTLLIQMIKDRFVCEASGNYGVINVLFIDDDKESEAVGILEALASSPAHICVGGTYPRVASSLVAWPRMEG